MGTPTLAEFIQTNRIHAGLSGAELARRIKSNQSNISLWESGKTAPREKTLPTLAKVLKVDKRELTTAYMRFKLAQKKQRRPGTA